MCSHAPLPKLLPKTPPPLLPACGTVVPYCCPLIPPPTLLLPARGADVPAADVLAVLLQHQEDGVGPGHTAVVLVAVLQGGGERQRTQYGIDESQVHVAGLRLPPPP